MGDYIYMQGTAQIKPSYIKPLQKFFNSRHDDADYELNWASLEDVWPDLSVYSAFYVLKNGRSSGVPFSMPNPTGWPNSFDELREDEGGSGYGTGECELSDDGLLLFKCSDRNRYNVYEAFVSLLPVFATDWRVQIDFREWFYALPEDEDGGIKTYAPDSATMDEALDIVCTQHKKMLKEALRDKAKRVVESFAEEDIRKMAESLGIDLATLDQVVPAEAVLRYTQLMQQPKFSFSPEFEQTLRDKLTAAFDLNLAFTTLEPESSNTTPFKSRPYVQEPRTTPLTSTKLGHFDTIIERIEAVKLFNRGKKGVRQIKRKQRRSMAN